MIQAAAGLRLFAECESAVGVGGERTLDVVSSGRCFPVQGCQVDESMHRPGRQQAEQVAQIGRTRPVERVDDVAEIGA